MLRIPSALLRAPCSARAVALPTALSRGVAPITARSNSSSSGNAPPEDNDVAGSSTGKDAAHPTSTASQPSTTQQPEPEKRKLTIAEQDALAFKQLDDREGSGAGNEILDGEYEKGMTRNTRKNQYRVI
jgi:hypothetical protein